jgi:hypothetical protein
MRIDIKPGSPDAPRFERLDQRVLVAHLRARGVDEIGVGLEQPYAPRVDHAAALVIERAVDRDEIAGGE